MRIGRRGPAIAIAAGLVVACLGGTAGPAQGGPQARDYAGGRMYEMSKGYDPSVLLSVRVPPTGSRVPYQLSTTLECGPKHEHYAFTLADKGTLSGDHLKDTGSRRLGPYVSATVTVSYRLDVTLTPQRGDGTLRIAGRVVVKGRAQRCTTPTRRIVLLARDTHPVAGPATPPAPSQLFAGITRGSPRPLHEAVLVLAGRTGRLGAAVWNTVAPCTRGSATRFTNYSPGRAIRGSRLVIRETFVIHYAHGVVAYFRPTFDGRFRSDGVRGTVRLRVRYVVRGKTYSRCDSGQRRFDARLVPGGVPG